jgi:hypothetical protein
MTNGSVMLDVGRVAALHRIFQTAPSETAPQSFKVGTGTSTPVSTDTDLTTPINIGASPTKAVSGGYPIFDTTNFVCTSRGLVDTTECNGSSISEFALCNQDVSPIVFSKVVFTPIAKTSSVQIIFLSKDQI